MTRIVIFHPDGEIEELDDWKPSYQSEHLPEGGWYWHTGDWYYVIHSDTSPVKWHEPSQVPAELRLKLLLLGVS